MKSDEPLVFCVSRLVLNYYNKPPVESQAVFSQILHFSDSSSFFEKYFVFLCKWLELKAKSSYGIIIKMQNYAITTVPIVRGAFDRAEGGKTA